MQVDATMAMEPPAGGRPEVLENALVTAFRTVNDADPVHYVRGQYDGYLDVDGVAPVGGPTALVEA